MAGASGPVDVPTKRRRIAELARQSPGMGFTSLAHFIDIDRLREAYRRTRKDGAVGVDGRSGADYAADLENNLRSLLERAESGTYQAAPVRRVRIPKAGSATETRPLGIPTFEGKVLQRAVVMVLEAIYEQDFEGCSYGFRPGRSAHQALESPRERTMATGGGWIVEVDIRKFFDTIDHGHLRELPKPRVRDGVPLRLIGKRPNAGVLEDGCVTHPEAGSPRGGVVGPMLCNVFLHYVLGDWFEREVRPRLEGHSFPIRFADDFVMGFTREEDARRATEVLPKRSEKYGLTIHPEKTRLVPFERPSDRPRRSATSEKTPAGTFDLLGFTHHRGRPRRGHRVAQRQTSQSRLRRGLAAIADWCRRDRHDALPQQHATVSRKLRGPFAYYGITGNADALQRFRRGVIGLWRGWLGRRHRAGEVARARMYRLLERYPLPPALVVHSVYRNAAEV